MLWISFLCTNKPSVAPCCLHICDSCTRIAQEKSGERYPNSVVSFGLNRAYIKIRTPNSPCTDNTWFFEYFYGFLGFLVWEISGHFWGVYQSHYCASAVAFLFSFVYVIYLNIASYLYGKQIKSKLWTKLYLWMIFICVRLNRLHFHECCPMPLKRLLCRSRNVSVNQRHEKHKMGKERWVLAFCQVSSNSMQRLQRRSRNFSTNERPGWPPLFSNRHEKHKLGRGR